jgi:hypothetical protein
MNVYMPSRLMAKNKHICTFKREIINHHVHSNRVCIDMICSIQTHMHIGTFTVKTLINQFITLTPNNDFLLFHHSLNIASYHYLPNECGSPPLMTFSFVTQPFCWEDEAHPRSPIRTFSYFIKPLTITLFIHFHFMFYLIRHFLFPHVHAHEIINIAIQLKSCIISFTLINMINLINIW